MEHCAEHCDAPVDAAKEPAGQPIQAVAATADEYRPAEQ